MHRFHIKPLLASLQPLEMIAHDAAGVLQLLGTMGCKAVNVERDGKHLFSAWIADSGLWRISGSRLAAADIRSESGAPRS